jgi:SAM-dependent methyltransferase
VRERFEQIYATGEWGIGSGEGSAAVHTSGYVRFLQRFLQDQSVRSVVDLGCGDWQFSYKVNWNNIHYRGYDLVRSVVERNQATYSAPNIEFHVISSQLSDLPTADLLIVKDVLQHWSNESIFEFLPVLRRFRYSLITNCVNTHGPTENLDIADGDFRYLDIRLAPVNVAATELYSFTNFRPHWWRILERPRWRKKVLLVRGTPQNARVEQQT